MGQDSLQGAASSEAETNPQISSDSPDRHVDLRRSAEASRFWRWGVPIGLVALIFLAFMPALTAGLVGWDDDDMLLFETRYRSLDGPGLWWMFTTSYTGHFQPLSWLTFSFDWAIWGRETFGFHLTNVVLHALTTLTFFFVAIQLLRFAGAPQRDRWAGDANVSTTPHPPPVSSPPMLCCAGVAAALFAIHPLRVESVAWLAERRDVLSGLFYVLSILFYLRYATTPADPEALTYQTASRQRIRSYVLMLLCCVLSLLAKASAVSLPIVLLILDIYPLRRWRRGQSGRPTSRRQLILEKLPLIVLAAAAGIRALAAQSAQGAMYPLTEYDIASRLAGSCYGLAFYVWKTLWPSNLGPLYPIPSRDVLFGSMLLWGTATVVALLVLAVATRRRLPAIAAALAFYTVQIFPVLGFVQSGPQLLADRYSYLSCMGFALLAGAGLYRLSQTRLWSRNAKLRAGATLSVAAVVVASMHATFRQSDIWLSSLTLWSHAVEVSPDSSIAHVNYADALSLMADPRGALAEYRKGLALNPSDVVALRHLAALLTRIGNVDLAIARYSLAVKLDPAYAPTYAKLAEVLIVQQRAVDAAELLRRRVASAPSDEQSAAFLVDLLSTYPDAAVRNGEEAERLAKRISDAHGGLDGTALMAWATSLAEAGRFQESVAAAEHALSIARRTGDEKLIKELDRRLARFRGGKPYHVGD